MSPDSLAVPLSNVFTVRRPIAPARGSNRWVPLAIAAAGFAPIGSLTLAVFEMVPMHRSAPVLIAAAVLTVIGLSVAFPRYGKTVLRGYAAALAAVALYDLVRLPFIVTGVWGDFIPHIGALLLNRSEGHRALGYTWRWLGNGGGMGLAFFMAYPAIVRGIEVRKAGLVYGVGIWACLIATILLAPHGEAMLFVLSPKTLALSLLGHVVFGGTLGVIMHRTGAHLAPHAPPLADEESPRGPIQIVQSAA